MARCGGALGSKHTPHSGPELKTAIPYSIFLSCGLRRTGNLLARIGLPCASMIIAPRARAWPTSVNEVSTILPRFPLLAGRRILTRVPAATLISPVDGVLRSAAAGISLLLTVRLDNEQIRPHPSTVRLYIQWCNYSHQLDSVYRTQVVYFVYKGSLMALREKKSEAIRMRKEGASYSQIKDKLKVSKSSLSLWLHDMPLPEKRLRELRDWNAVRIERFSNTMRRKREDRWAEVRKRAKKDMGSLSRRELLIAGLFLYWGEGGKTMLASTSVSNTDPAMLRFFIRWLELLGVSKNRLRVHIHLYADMDIKEELQFWSKALNLPSTSFTKPYIKNSNRAGLSYRQKFTHGTCNVLYHNRDVSEYVLMALDCIRDEFAETDGV